MFPAKKIKDNSSSSSSKPGKGTNSKVLTWMERLFLWVFGAWIGKIHFYKKIVNRIREGTEKGSVVLVLQFANRLDYLILCWFLRREDLPLPTYPKKPKRKDKKRSKTEKNDPSNVTQMPSAPQPGEVRLLFLQRKSNFFSEKKYNLVDPIAELIEAQKVTRHPIYFLPIITVWTKRPIILRRSAMDVFFGNTPHPGAIRKFVIFLYNCKNAFIKSGDLLDVTPWTEPEITEHGMDPAREIRWRLFQFFSEERTAIAGPASKPRAWILESVLRSQAMQDAIEQVSRESDRPVEEVRLEAAENLDKIAADYRFSFIWMAEKFLNMFRHIFERFVLDEREFDELRERMKKGPVVFTPSHKSHVDYLLFSYIMFKRALVAPHIIAGDNLSFWPMGFFFRRMGAIFIRRSFKGDVLYSVALKTYLQRILWEGYSIEFYIEGTRSRTGKVMLPKLGILSILVDSYLANPSRDLVFQPLSIVYGKLIEQQSYTNELVGGAKRKESLSGLLKIFKLLRFSFGSIYVRFGEPISFRDYLASRGISPAQMTHDTHRRTVRELGSEIIWRINSAVTATPTSVVSLALISSTRKGITQKKLLDRIERILRYLRNNKAKLSDNMEDSLWAVTETINHFVEEGKIHVHTIGDEKIFTIDDGSRISLDYYKNQILHYFVPPAFIALAYSSFGEPKAPLEEVRKRAEFLADLFHLELQFSPRASFDEVFETALDYFKEAGFVTLDAHGNLRATATSGREFTLLRLMINNYIESYWVVALALPMLIDETMEEREFSKRVMEYGQKLQLIGKISQAEAFSKNNFNNAIKYFMSRGVLQRDQPREENSMTALPPDILVPIEELKKEKKKKSRRSVKIRLAKGFQDYETLKPVAEEIDLYRMK